MYLISKEAVHNTCEALEQAGLHQVLKELEDALIRQPAPAVYLGKGPWIKNEQEEAK